MEKLADEIQEVRCHWRVFFFADHLKNTLKHQKSKNVAFFQSDRIMENSTKHLDKFCIL